MKKQNFITLAILISITSLLSCKKSENINEEKKDRIQSNPDLISLSNNISIDQYRNYIRKEYSKALAKSFTLLEVRNFIKEKINITLKGETEMLHAEYFNSTIQINGTSFSQILANNSNHSITFFTDTVIIYDPRLTILIPDDFYPENWQTLSTIPKVTYNPAGWVDSIEINVEAFNESGECGYFSSEEQPEELTIVVSETESIEPFSKPYYGNNNDLYFENNHYSYYTIVEEFDTTGSI